MTDEHQRDGGKIPTDHEVITALAASGHLLEVEVAAELETLGFNNVETNRPFTDPTEGTSREIDVWANYTALHDTEAKLSIYAQLLIECKATAAPFAVLTRPERETSEHEPREIVFPRARLETGRTPLGNGSFQIHEQTAFDALGLVEHYWPFAKPGVGVSVIRMHRSNKEWRADNNAVFDSLIYPLAKALDEFRKEFVPPARPRAEDWRAAVIFVPVVVIASPLFVVDSSGPTPQVERPGHCRVRRELKAKDVTGTYNIEFVERDSLAAFVTECVIPFADHVASLAREMRPPFDPVPPQR